jgi:hypothetical protein
MWWQIPPSGKLSHAVIGRKMAYFSIIGAKKDIGTGPAKRLATGSSTWSAP